MIAQIRRYVAHDLGRCRELWAELTQCHRSLYEDPSIGGESPALFFGKHLAQVGPDRIWVAEVNKEVVGFVGLMVNDREASERGAVVEPLVIAHSHRNKGIGRTLLTHAVEEAKKLNVRYLSVKPVARNVEAIALYHNSGFRILAQIGIFMELQPSPRGTWKEELELFGYRFSH